MLTEDASGAGDAGGGSVFTPPPGSPGAIRAAAQQLSSQGTAAGDLAASTRRTSQTLTTGGSWTGAAATAFSGFAGKVDGLAGTSEEPTTAIAGGASRYADALEVAQRRITAAAARYTAASQKAAATTSSVNADANRSPAQVAAAQQQVDALGEEMTAAEDEARSAWKTYESEAQAAASEIAAAGESAEKAIEDSGLLELLDVPNEWNEKAHSVWDITAADVWLEKYTKLAVGKGKALTKAAQEVEEDLLTWTTKKQVLELMDEMGQATEGDVAEAAQLGRRLDALEAFFGTTASQAKGMTALGRGLAGLGKVAGATAIVGDTLTIIHPEDTGTMGWVDRGAAGVNGVVAGAALAGLEVPGVGTAVAVGAGAYLAGDYLYHHWTPFRNVCNDVGSEAVSLGKGVANTAVGAYHAAGSAASSVAGEGEKLASGAWNKVSGWL